MNHGVTEHAKVRVHAEDGRTFIHASRRRFDVIVGDLFLPWSAGAGRLYSVEHFQAAHDALSRGGVFCQWLPMYQFTREQFDVVLATLLQVFSEVHLFRNTFHPDRPSAALVGFRESRLDWSILERKAAALRDHGLVLDPSIRHAEGLSMLYLGRETRRTHRATRVNTLDNLWLELDAGRQRLLGEPGGGYLLEKRWNDFLKERIQRLKSDGVPEFVQARADMGFLLTNWEIARRIRHPAEGELQSRLNAAFPSGLTSDMGANWKAWPGLTGW